MSNWMSSSYLKRSARVREEERELGAKFMEDETFENDWKCG
ncbi:MAG: hypothetical protein ACMG6E_04360 [Candidatus Roizmanbacteria bacterium]